MLKVWEDGIFVKTPAWKPSAALVYLQVGETSKVPASGDMLRAYYEFVEQKAPSAPRSLMVPEQEFSDLDPQPPSAMEAHPPSFLHYNMSDDDDLTVEFLEDLAGREDHKGQGFTPLMIAAYIGNGALIEALLNRGHSDNLHATDSHGRGALWWGLRGSVWDGESNRIIFSENIPAGLQLLLTSCEQAEAMQGLDTILIMDRVHSSGKTRKRTEPSDVAAENEGQSNRISVDLPSPTVPTAVTSVGSDPVTETVIPETDPQKVSIRDDMSRRLERLDITSLHPKDSKDFRATRSEFHPSPSLLIGRM